MTFFENLTLLPADPIFKLPIAFEADKNPDKVNLGMGVYKTDEGKSQVLSSVVKAESLLASQNLGKDYLPIEGNHESIKESLNLIFGNECKDLVSSNKIFACQTIGASGALRLGADFLLNEITKFINISNPTWPNHSLIFSRAGLKIHEYPYYDSQNHCLDYQHLVDAIKKMVPGSAILFHGCCHNPTGLDPSFEQWKELSSLIKMQKLIPFFDIAYQGFGTDLDQDLKGFRYFLEQEHELFFSYSYAKNLGLYGERMGILGAVTNSKSSATKITSHLKQLIRGSYSSPPIHGALIVLTILQNDVLRKEWVDELSQMRQRIILLRNQFAENLRQKIVYPDFNFIKQQKGLFSFFGLTEKQVQLLKEKNGIYLPDNGRLNLAGLNEQNINYVVDSIVSLLKSK